MISAVFGFVLALGSALLSIFRLFSKNAKSYFAREMDTYYIGEL